MLEILEFVLGTVLLIVLGGIIWSWIRGGPLRDLIGLAIVILFVESATLLVLNIGWVPGVPKSSAQASTTQTTSQPEQAISAVTTQTAAANTGSVAAPETAIRYEVSKADSLGMVRSVTVTRANSGGVEVHFEGSNPLKVTVSRVPNPERIVLDLVNVRCGRALRLPVNAVDVQAVRLGLYQRNPPITRAVLDLTRPHPYHIFPAGNTVILRVDAKAETQISLPAKDLEHNSRHNGDNRAALK